MPSSLQRSRRTRSPDEPTPMLARRQRRAARQSLADPVKRLTVDLIVRALRHAGAHSLLHGGSGAVALIVPHAEDLQLFKDASEALLERTRRKRQDIDLIVEERQADAVWTLSPQDKPRWNDADAAALLAKRRRVLVLATDTTAIPLFFRQAAEAIAPIHSCDAHSLRGMLHAFFGQAPAVRELPDVSGLSITAIAAALRTRASLSRALAALRRVTQASKAAAAPIPKDGPTLDDLHGVAEAAEWGYELAADFAAYMIREITFAEMSQGVVLHGSSGVGKTLVAQAIARSCGVSILIHSLARWQAQGHLGDLLKAMRKAFHDAKKAAPCILFLDEIDSFGDRGQFTDARHEQYCREVINGFLECLDGAEGREGVVVIGATNFPNKIDPAILRPGRLERLIAIPLPDAPARAGILRYHLGEHLPGADLLPLAQKLEGLSGAALEKVVRDAKRRARRDRRRVTLEDLNASTPNLIVLSEAAYHRTCLHEAAHALVGWLVMHETANPPLMARVIREAPPGLPAGETLFGRQAAVPLTRTAYLGDIAALLAGLVAETMLLGEHCDGAGSRVGSDLHHATVRALALEASAGMGASLIYRGGMKDRDFLDLLRMDADLRARVEETLRFCRKQAESLLSGHREALLELTEALAGKGQIDFPEIRAIVEAHIPDPIPGAAPGASRETPRRMRRERQEIPTKSSTAKDPSGH